MCRLHPAVAVHFAPVISKVVDGAVSGRATRNRGVLLLRRRHLLLATCGHDRQERENREDENEEGHRTFHLSTRELPDEEQKRERFESTGEDPCHQVRMKITIALRIQFITVMAYLFPVFK